MLFTSLVKLRKKPTKEMLAETQKLQEEAAKEGHKILGMYWTLGRYDAVILSESPDEKAAMKAAIKFAEVASSETLVAVPAEEAQKLV